MNMKKTNGARRCRLCACEEGLCNFLNIFNDNSGLQLETKISRLLPIVVVPWDPMPHTVCQKCMEKLNLFNDFYESCLKAERFLRTLYPSAPETELEELNPVVEADSSLLSKSPLKLPPKKRQGLEFLQSPNNDDVFPKKSLSCFIINHITSRDSVFTCRECFRTFTKQSSALTHSCVRIEDCGEIETIDLDDEGEKSLPPLKIRLFSVKSGSFVCYLCQGAFEKKADVIEHIQKHILKDGEKNVKQKGKRKGRGSGGSDDDDWEESNKKRAARKRKKRNTSTPRKRGRPKTGEECQSEGLEKCKQCLNSPNLKETAEQTTQCSDVSVELQEKQPPVAPNSVVEYTEPNVVVETPKTPEPEEEPVEPPKDTMSDEITVLEVINNRMPTIFSSCVFCDKIFATKEALISHQNKHTQGVVELKSEMNNPEQTEEETYLCSICAMLFTNYRTLVEHEQYHFVDLENVGCQKGIRIALNHEFPIGEIEQECQISKEKGVITIRLSTLEKKFPQIEYR